jgi:hypothetical protein
MGMGTAARRRAPRRPGSRGSSEMAAWSRRVMRREGGGGAGRETRGEPDKHAMPTMSDQIRIEYENVGLQIRYRESMRWEPKGTASSTHHC